MQYFNKRNLIPKLIRPHFKAQLALYSPTLSKSKVTEISQRRISAFLTVLATAAHELHVKNGGTLDFLLIKEVVDNLIHSNLTDPLITVFADGTGIRVADHGPGIADKDLAMLPGYSTATTWHRQYIRGVGQGLALVRAELAKTGGQLEISNNLSGGTVVTLWGNNCASSVDLTPHEQLSVEGSDPPLGEKLTGRLLQQNIYASLTDRQRSIITVLDSHGPLGPSKLAEYINSSPSSAYRDMVALTELGVLIQIDGGKRMLNPQVQHEMKRSLGD